ncbi:unnamed protein product [Jaminaea pallidilutea]
MRSTNILRLSRSAARFEAEIPIGKATPKVSPVSQPQTSSAASTASSSSATASGSPFTSAHRSYVKSLYKRTLKNELDWIVRRDIWRDRAIEVRAEFERNRHIRNPRELAQVLQAAEARLADNIHPDPYKPPQAEDGTKWERNLPPPFY